MPTDAQFRLHRRQWLKALAAGGAASALTHSLAEDSANSSNRKIRGIIFMVSDGMSPGVLTLAEAFSRQTRNRGTSWWSLMNQPGVSCGLMDTAAANSLVTDSAAASSAWGGGKRVPNGSINTNADGSRQTPIAEIIHAKGGKVGLVTTATITHATPAGFAANANARSNEQAIALQYLNRVDVLLGGGSGFFSASKRQDKLDLAGEFSRAGYSLATNRDTLLAAKQEKILGTFTPGHLPFSIDHQQLPELAAKIPTLAEMATAALDRFLSQDKPFLLQIEGARIDHAAHLNDIAGLLHDQLAFDDTLALVLSRVAKRNDILVITTSDHGNSNPGLSGTGVRYEQTNQHFESIARMKASHERLLEDWNTSKGDQPALISQLVSQQLGFELKPEEAQALFEIVHKHPVLEWNEQLGKPEGLLGQFAGNHTGIGWIGTSHTSDPTLLNAFGPHSERFTGIVRNDSIFGHLHDLLT